MIEINNSVVSPLYYEEYDIHDTNNQELNDWTLGTITKDEDIIVYFKRTWHTDPEKEDWICIEFRLISKEEVTKLLMDDILSITANRYGNTIYICSHSEQNSHISNP